MANQRNLKTVKILTIGITGRLLRLGMVPQPNAWWDLNDFQIGAMGMAQCHGRAYLGSPAARVARSSVRPASDAPPV